MYSKIQIVFGTIVESDLQTPPLPSILYSPFFIFFSKSLYKIENKMLEFKLQKIITRKILIVGKNFTF